jgi:NAD(P)-dependent dehydrogenase (short-subunit alcohol dehydrogenase family)
MSYNPFSLEGKTILITGASSGIGQATAIECSKMGAKLIITARNEDRLNETFRQLEGEGHQKIIADLMVKDDIDRIVDIVPQLDGLVNNAGIVKVRPIQFINENDLIDIIKTNTFAPFFLTQYIYIKKKFNKGASIVFTSSIGGVFSVSQGNTMYGMSKGAIDVFMRNAALEMASKGIRCNSVNPGMVETSLVLPDGIFSEADIEKNIAEYPLKRYGRPKEIAFGIIYLLSNASSWITGISLKIDGGKTLH